MTEESKGFLSRLFSREQPFPSWVLIEVEEEESLPETTFLTKKELTPQKLDEAMRILYGVGCELSGDELDEAVAWWYGNYPMRDETTS